MEGNKTAEKIKAEGVNCKGYGLVYKFVMLDTDLSPESKSIYAYLCSFAGNKTTAFPGRDKILNDLKLSKNGYYHHYKQLIKHGYIRVVKSGGIFSKNTYVLEQSPEKLLLDINKSAQTLKECGYGFIPKAVMVDERLDIKAKAIYAYLVCFGDVDKTAHPRHSIMIHHLKMSEKTFYRYYRQLLDCGYITAQQQRNVNKYDVNLYRLNEYPSPDKKERAHTSHTNRHTASKSKDATFADSHFTHTPPRDSTIITKRTSTKKNNNSKSSFHAGKSYQKALDPALIEDEIQNIKVSLNYDEATCNLTQPQTAEIDKSIQFIAEMLLSTDDIFLMGSSFFRKADFKNDLSSLTCSDLTLIWDRIRNAAKPIVNIKNYILSSINNQCIKNKLQRAERSDKPSYRPVYSPSSDSVSFEPSFDSDFSQSIPSDYQSSFNLQDFFDKSVARGREGMLIDDEVFA
jgi:DNA-binding transcriptional ArsR family regulator